MHSQKRGGVSPRIENDRLLADGGSQGKSERLEGIVDTTQNVTLHFGAEFSAASPKNMAKLRPAPVDRSAQPVKEIEYVKDEYSQ